MTWGNRPSLKETHPSLVKEWDYPKNESLFPGSVTQGSNKKVWWCCFICGYKWEAFINNRTYRHSGCPSCSGQVVNDKNRLSYIVPDIFKEWDKEKNHPLSSQDVAFSSHRKVW